MKVLCLFALFLIAATAYAQQQPGVDCAPIQGNGWQGCAPVNQSQQLQQPRAPQTPPQVWLNYWGALSTDTPKGILGSSANATSQEGAEQAALADCRAKGGMQCKLQISFRNGCAAMVMSDKSFNVQSGATSDEAIQKGIEAIQKGMTMCNGEANCHVYYSTCSFPTRVQ